MSLKTSNIIENNKYLPKAIQILASREDAFAGQRCSYLASKLYSVICIVPCNQAIELTCFFNNNLRCIMCLEHSQPDSMCVTIVFVALCWAGEGGGKKNSVYTQV